jgi:uncharacterized protein (DUF305 family)
MIRAVVRLVAVAVVVAGAIQLGVNLTDDDTPAEGSADVGFARDMRTHHSQAVEMAELLRDRTRDEDLRVVAADITLTQQAQIGQMRGWLDAWGFSPTNTDPPMAWAHGEAGDHEMPGLANEDDIAALTAARDEDAEILFLRLMVRHHEGGVEMALRATELVDQDEARALARTIAESQLAEIRYLTGLLTARDAEPLPSILPDDVTALGSDAADDDDRADDLWDFTRRWWLVGVGGLVLIVLVRDLVRRPRPPKTIGPPIPTEETPVATVTAAPDEHPYRDDDPDRFPTDDSGFDDL